MTKDELFDKMLKLSDRKQKDLLGSAFTLFELIEQGKIPSQQYTNEFFSKVEKMVGVDK